MRTRQVVAPLFFIAAFLFSTSMDAKVFQLENGPADLQDISSSVEVYYRSMRFNRVSNDWNFELVLRNIGLAPLTRPVVVLLESYTNTSGAISPENRDNDGKAYYEVSTLIPQGGLVTGDFSAAKTLALGVTTGVPQVTMRVFGLAPLGGPALAFVRTLNEVGQPLSSVAIVTTGPVGQATNSTDQFAGVATLGQGPGTNTFFFSAPNCLPVWRTHAITAGTVLEIPSPRLTVRGTNVLSISGAGGTLSNALGNFLINFPSGAFAGSATATLTPLTPQTLPAALPAGWSPLQAFWLELSSEPLTPISVRFDLWGPIRRDETAVLSRWNAVNLRWEVVRLITGLGAAFVSTSVPGSGAWALIVADTGLTAPPVPQVGATVPGSTFLGGGYSSLEVATSINPSSSAPSARPELVTGTASMVVSNRAGALASGTLLRGLVAERYEMRDGTLRTTPSYQSWFVGYQRPAGTAPSTVQAAFPVRPALLFGPDELVLGVVNVDLLPPTSFAGAVFTPSGGSLTNGSVRVNAGAGAVGQPQAIQLTELPISDFVSLETADAKVVRAFQLTAGEFTPGSLDLQIAELATNAPFVLARVLSTLAVYGLQPVARVASDANGVLSSVEPAVEPKLHGLNASGQFVLVEVNSLQQLVSGTARTTQGNLAGGLIVRVGPWTSLSGTDGKYLSLAAAGEANLSIQDPGTGDAGNRIITVSSTQPVLNADLATSGAGPRVLAVSPADGSTNAALVASIGVTFSKALNPGTAVGQAVQLLQNGSNAVAASMSMNLRSDQITLLPVNPLEPQTAYTLMLSRSLADAGGLTLTGPNQFSFLTAPAPFSRAAGAQLITYEPTNGVMPIQGTPGFAQPGQPVLLVNETSGRTTTVLAKPDGTFSGALAASVDDEMSVSVVNANGTRDRITPNRQIFIDGSVALFPGGGTIEVPGEHGPISFSVEAGAIASKTKLKFESIPLANVLTLVSNVQPESGRILGGVNFSAIQGSQVSQRIEVSFPVNVSQMQLPNGVEPTNCAYGLAIARVVDGERVFELVDRMHFEDGKLVTHSPPFFGLLGPFEDILVMPLLLAVGSTGLAVDGRVYAVQVDTGTGRPAPGAPKEYLPGAFVSARQASSANQILGRLRPGSVYAVAGAEGHYSLLVSVNPFDPSRAVSVTASHPRFAGIKPETGIPDLDPAMRLAIGDILLGTDVYFPLRAFAQRAPPAIAVSQAPAEPPVGTNVILTIVSTDNDSTPRISVSLGSVVSLVPGITAVPADVTLTFLSDEEPAPKSRRSLYSVTCTKAAQVQLIITSIDDDGNKTEQVYPVLFGAPEQPINEDIPVADPNDHSGPYVVFSQPSSGSVGLAPGDPIVLQFNKPINRQVVSQAPLFTIAPSAGVPQLALSRDQTLLTVSYPMLVPGTTYTFSVNNIKDLSGNLLDQDPVLEGSQGYNLSFSTAPAVITNLVDTIGGNAASIVAAGTVILGSYAYVLERRGTSNGRLAVFDIRNPAAPTLAGAYDCPPFPRDLVLIPQYSFATTNPAFADIPPTVDMFTNVITRDLIAIVGGLAGEGQMQWLRIVDLSNPAGPKRLAGAVIGAASGLMLPTRIKWSPPMLAYLEVGQPCAVSLVNLQEFIIGDVLTSNQTEYRKLPDDGRPGVDNNGDGDYVDPGETLPLPAKFPLDFAGKQMVVGVFDTDQIVNEFAVEAGGSYVGVVVEHGYLLGTDGLPIKDAAHEVLPAFRSIFSAGLQLDRVQASYSFTNGRPRRVTTLFQQPFVVSNQVVRLDLAVVGVRGDATNRLAVLDITDRLGIKLLTEVPLPPLDGSSNIFSLVKRDDGLLVAASDAHSYLIDPGQFMAPPTNGGHPAVIGVLPGIGGGAATFASTELGIHASSGPDGKASVVQTAPRLRFVCFPSVAPFSPSTLVGKSDVELNSRLAAASPQDFLLPSRYRAAGDSLSSVTNLDPASHYYVLVQAPGGCGPTIDLALESLNRSGAPLQKRGLLFPPVHAFTGDTLQNLLQVPADDDAPVRPSRAWRLSNDPQSGFFNTYLSRPFVLVGEEMSKADLASVDAQLERDVLWSGASLRASFDPGAGTNSALKSFAGHVDGADREYKPGAETVAAAFAADYVQSPNPGPIAGAMNLPLAFNTLAPHSGEITHEATDLELPGRRLGIHFKRTYCGQGLFAGPFGRGWDFSYNQRISELNKALPPGATLPQVVRATTDTSEIATNRDLLFYTGGGRIVIFKFSGLTPPAEIANDPLVQDLGWLATAASFYLPPAGLFSPMFKFKDGTYGRLEPDGTQYRYDTLGRLVRIYDRFQKNVLEFLYNGKGELSAIQDELSRRLEIGYFRIASDPSFRFSVDESTTNPGELGKIARLKDYADRDVLFKYTQDGLLERRLGVQVDTTALPDSFTGRQVTRYLYSDGSDPLRSAKSLIGVIGDDSSGAPFLAATELGAKGRDSVSKLLIGGKAVSVQQEHENTALALSRNGGRTIVTQPDNSQTAFQFDSFGRVTNSVYSGQNAPTLGTRSEYYTNGLLKAVTYPEGNRIEYYYDEGNPSLRSRGNLLRVRRTPGPRGGPSLEATTHFDPWYNLPEGPKTDFNGNTAVITLRSDHKDTEFVDSGGVREEYRANDYGQLVYSRNAGGVVQERQYNESTGFLNWTSLGGDKVVYGYAPNTTGSGAPEQLGYATSLTTENQVTKNNTYDERGNLVREERGGLLIKRAFDASGRCIKTVTLVDSGREIIQEHSYNQLGFMLTNRVQNVEVDGSAQDLVSVYIPDDANRIKEAFLPAGDHHLLGYDHLGRLVSYEVEGVYAEIQAYDGNGNLTNRFNGVGNESFSYDGHDRLISTRTANGTLIEQQLDGNGNVLVRSARDALGQLLYASTNSYDALNRPLISALQRDNGFSSSSIAYDSLNRRVIIRDALGASLTNSFDTAGRLVSSAGPLVTITSAYDGEGNLRSRTTLQEDGTYFEQFQYDSLGYATNHIDPLGYSSFNVIGLDGRILQLHDKEGFVVTNTYTLLGEKTSETDPNGVQTRFSYDLNRKLSATSDARNQATRNSFDSAGRLTAETLPDLATSAYTNFTSLAVPTTARLPRNISVSLEYDVMGKVTNRVISSQSSTRRESYSYDGLQRPQRLEDPNGSMETKYDLMGPAKEITYNYIFRSNPPSPAQLQFSLRMTSDPGAFRTTLSLPNGRQTNYYTRDISGRLLNLTNGIGEPIINTTTYAGPDVVKTRVFGESRIQLQLGYDGDQRTTARQYKRLSDARVLVDFRYGYDRNAVIVARQDVHRGGRTDLFRYDPGYRLLRADYDAHPSLGSGQKSRTLPDFAAPPQLPGQWAAGPYARAMQYNNLDLLTNLSPINPDALSLPPMASSLGDGDALLFQANVDGFTRVRDEVGNITRTQLLVREPGQTTPVLVSATLTYDDLGRLTSVQRDDGVTIINEYNLQGERIRRRVTGDSTRCVPSDTAFIYDGPSLLEERDLTRGGALLATYYHADGAPVAVDADPQHSGSFSRFYLLTDQLGTVRAIADGSGAVVQRVNYDAWGQPTIELADNKAPRVSRIVRDGTDLVIVFSEAALPTLLDDGSLTNLETSFSDVSQLITVEQGGTSVPAIVTLEESVPGYPYASCYRVRPSATLAGSVAIIVKGSGVADEWGNSNPAETLNVNVSQGPILYSGPDPGSTAAVSASRDITGCSLLFHGQVFDYDTGLLYCRARYYDPYTAAFLQRDPEGYADSVNQYAAFNHNPINLTDRTGTAAADYADRVRQFGRDMADNYGVPGQVVNVLAKGVAWFMELGTGASEGWDMLNSDRQGSFGLIDRMRGAQVLVDEGNKVLMAGMVLHVAGRMIASKVQGYAVAALARREANAATAAARQTRSYAQAARELRARGGWHGIESESALHATDLTGVSAHARYNEAKAAARYDRVSEGYYGPKPGSVTAKSDSSAIADSFVTSEGGINEYWDKNMRFTGTGKDGPIQIWRVRKYTSDIDFYAFTKGSRLATASEIASWENAFRTRFEQLKLLRGMPQLQYPKMHPSQLELGQSFGRMSAGKKVNNELLEKVAKMTQNSTILTIAPGGSVHRTADSYLNGLLDQAEPGLMRLQRHYGEEPIGFKGPWRFGTRNQQ